MSGALQIPQTEIGPSTIHSATLKMEKDGLGLDVHYICTRTEPYYTVGHVWLLKAGQTPTPLLNSLIH